MPNWIQSLVRLWQPKPQSAAVPGYIAKWQSRRQPKAQTEKFTQKNLYIFPAMHGLSFLIVVFLIWMLGTIYENNLVLLLAFFLLAVFVSTIFSTHANLDGLTLRFGDADPVFCGEELQIPLIFTNSSGSWRRRVFVRYQGSEQVVDVPPKADAITHLRIRTKTRGWLALGRIRVHSHYPLGVLQAWSYPLLKSNCLVYPKPVARQITSANGSESLGVAPAGRGIDDFAGLAEWQPGVPAQRIAWKQFSAGKGMLEKTFEAQAGNPTWIDWDSYDGIGVEDRLAAMCAKALEMETAQQSYGLRLPGYQLIPAQGERHLRQVLTALAIYPDTPQLG